MDYDFADRPNRSNDPREEWERSHLSALETQSGQFLIWVAATDGGKEGSSACAWRIEDPTRAVTEEVWPGRPVWSSEKKAYVAGVAGALDRLPKGSTAKICCREEYVVGAINGNLHKWRAAGELEGKRPYSNVWQHVLAAWERITSNRLDIVAYRPATTRDEQIIEELKERARDQRGKKR